VQGSLIHGPKKPCLIGFVLHFFLGSTTHGDPTYENGERINERKVKHALGLLPNWVHEISLPKTIWN
jgi:hypothetical protein